MITKLMTAVLILAAFSANGLIISLDAESPTDVSGADLLRSFGSNQYEILLTAEQIGLKSEDNIDALHQGFHGSLGTWFSVDAASTGADGSAVNEQSLLDESSGDVFVTGQLYPIPFSNELAVDEEKLGLASLDNIDAMHWNNLDTSLPFLFSLSQGSPTLTSDNREWSGADILMSSNGVVTRFLEAGLDTGPLSELDARDDIDALDFSDYDPFFSTGGFYSLAPGSFSLGNNSAAQIFGNGGALFSSPEQMGLIFDDNIDALASTFDCSLDPLDDCDIPEPESIFLFLLGLTGFILSRKHK